MLIPESMAVYFLGGAAFGAIAALFILFLIGLLYRLDSMNSEHLCADEVDFDAKKLTEFDKHEKSRPYWRDKTRLENPGLSPSVPQDGDLRRRARLRRQTEDVVLDMAVEQVALRALPAKSSDPKRIST